MIASAIRCLLLYITSDNCYGFDELRFNMYHKMGLKFSIEQFYATPICVKHVLRAYLQCYM